MRPTAACAFRMGRTGLYQLGGKSFFDRTTCRVSTVPGRVLSVPTDAKARTEVLAGATRPPPTRVRNIPKHDPGDVLVFDYTADRVSDVPGGWSLARATTLDHAFAAYRHFRPQKVARFCGAPLLSKTRQQCTMI